MSASRLHRLDMYLSVLLLVTFAPFTSAQTSNQSSNIVLLESHEKSVVVSGELVEATNGQYRISTVAGEIVMDLNAVSCLGDACPLVVPVFASGAQVRLTSGDGSVNITGNITDIVDNQYVVVNDVLGSMRIGTDVVKCSGPGCPDGLRFADESAAIDNSAPAVRSEAETDPADPVVKSEAEADPAAPVVKAESETTPEADTQQINRSIAPVSFAGSDTVGLGLLPFLLEDYAGIINASADTQVISETETLVRYVGPDETELTSIYVNATGSGDATDALETKAAVFGMTSRQIEDDEARRLIAAGSSDLRNSEYETVIAADSLAIVTHPSNPVSELTMAELGAIYLGQIDNWSQVGGPDAPITVMSREDGSSTRGVFENAVFNGEEPALVERVTYPGGDNPEMAAAVKNDAFAIGYVGIAYSEGLNRLELTSECGITYSATSFSVKTEEYPLSRRLYLYSRADNTPEQAKRFMEYVLSADADDAIAESNFVNFAVERTPLSPSRYDELYEGLNEPSVAQLADQLKGDLSLWDRLSTTVRFRFDSFTLDKKAQNDIDRLISKLSELPRGTQIAAVGFTDDVGPFEANLLLSRQRAQTVADLIRSAALDNDLDVEIETRSFSELSPSVCNANFKSRAINRRVEIWIRK